MAWAVAALAVAGGLVSAIGQVKGGIEAKEQAEYNATVAEGEAGMIRAGAEVDLFRQRKQADAMTGKQIGKYSRAGVSVGTGSPLDVYADSLANSNLEIEIGQFNASQAAKRRESEAKMIRRYGQQDYQNSMIQAGATLLSSSAKGASRLSKETPKTTKIKGKEKIGE